MLYAILIAMQIDLNLKKIQQVEVVDSIADVVVVAAATVVVVADVECLHQLCILILK